jgi:hypothetical protein
VAAESLNLMMGFPPEDQHEPYCWECGAPLADR